MSYQENFGAFPIGAEGNCLDPKPNAMVGELRGSSRNGAFFLALRDLLNVFPSHEALGFFADESSNPEQRKSDGALWTILDERSILPVVAALDGLLRACHESSILVANGDFFEGLKPDQVRSYLATAKECTDVNVETPCDDGDSPEFLFAALVSRPWNSGFVKSANRTRPGVAPSEIKDFEPK